MLTVDGKKNKKKNARGKKSNKGQLRNKKKVQICDVELFWSILQENLDSVIIFSKNQTSDEFHELLDTLAQFAKKTNTTIVTADLEKLNDPSGASKIDLTDLLIKETQDGSFPKIFYRKKYVGSCGEMLSANLLGQLELMLSAPACPLFHLAVVGGGPGAVSAIEELEGANLKLRVALVDPCYAAHSEQNECCQLGPCYRGSASFSLLKGAMRVLRDQKFAQKVELSSNDHEAYRAAWKDILGRIRDYNIYFNWEMRKKLRKLNISYYHGDVTFQGENMIRINSNNRVDTASTEIMAMKFIICGVSTPKRMSFPGMGNAIPVDHFLLTDVCLPSRTVIFGNTPLVFEVASLIALCKSKVTIMASEREDWLPEVDRGCAEKILKYLEQELKISFVKVLKVSNVERSGPRGNSRVVTAPTPSGEVLRVECRQVLYGTARVPATARLGVERAGVETDGRSGGIFVDGGLRTSNGNVYAFGAVARGHSGSEHFEALAGSRAMQSILGGAEPPPLPAVVPACMSLGSIDFASLGETEETGKEKYKGEMKIYESTKSELGLRIRGPFYAKVVCRDFRETCPSTQRDEKVIGLHLLGPDVLNIIIGLAESIESGLFMNELQTTFSNLTNGTGTHHTQLKVSGSCFAETTLGTTKIRKLLRSVDQEEIMSFLPAKAAIPKRVAGASPSEPIRGPGEREKAIYECMSSGEGMSCWEQTLIQSRKGKDFEDIRSEYKVDEPCQSNAMSFLPATSRIPLRETP